MKLNTKKPLNKGIKVNRKDVVNWISATAIGVVIAVCVSVTLSYYTNLRPYENDLREFTYGSLPNLSEEGDKVNGVDIYYEEGESLMDITVLPKRLLEKNIETIEDKVSYIIDTYDAYKNMLLGVSVLLMVVVTLWSLSNRNVKLTIYILTLSILGTNLYHTREINNIQNFLSNKPTVVYYSVPDGIELPDSNKGQEDIKIHFDYLKEMGVDTIPDRVRYIDEEKENTVETFVRYLVEHDISYYRLEGMEDNIDEP